LSFRINSNIEALKAYNALAKVNAQTQKAQLRLATGKRINSIADDTSGYSIGMSLQSKMMVQKSELNNASVAQNYLSTAETALVQVNDLITQISGKYADSQNALADRSAIADDIRSIASEIDSILKSTKFNDKNLLAQSDGSALASSDVFDVGSDVTMDFAASNYLNVDAISDKINGASDGTGVKRAESDRFDLNDTLSETIKIQLEVTYADGTSYNKTTGDMAAGMTREQIIDTLQSELQDGSNLIYPTTGGGLYGIMIFHNDNFFGDNPNKYVTDVKITDVYDGTPVDLQSFFGMPEEFGPREAGLTSSSDNDVLSAASDVATISQNVKKALGRIGNLMQTLDSKSDFLTASITNSNSSISRLFDTDMAMEQLNATKGSIGSNATTSILSQLNMSPQSFLQLLG